MRTACWALALLATTACGFEGDGDPTGGGDDDGDGDDPTTPTPALFESCLDAKLQGQLTSGVYNLVAGGGATYQAYCDQVNQGGGWTLVLKADGTRDTFRYAAPVWTDGQLLRPDAPGHDLVEAKLASYDEPADELLIETLDGATQFLQMDLPDDYSLAERIELGLPQAFLPLANRTSDWERLVAQRELPSCAILDGINVGDASTHRARIGVVGTDWDEYNCDEDWEAAIGIGLDTDDGCDGGSDMSTSVGWNDGGCYEHAVFAYVFVR